jgi:hypothetical protein
LSAHLLPCRPLLGNTAMCLQRLQCKMLQVLLVVGCRRITLLDYKTYQTVSLAIHTKHQIIMLRVRVCWIAAAMSRGLPGDEAMADPNLLALLQAVALSLNKLSKNTLEYSFRAKGSYLHTATADRCSRLEYMRIIRHKGLVIRRAAPRHRCHDSKQTPTRLRT